MSQILLERKSFWLKLGGDHSQTSIKLTMLLIFKRMLIGPHIFLERMVSLDFLNLTENVDLLLSPFTDQDEEIV